MADLTKKDLTEITKTMKDISGDEKINDLMDSLIKLLALPEEQFEILAPGIMQSFQQVINNPNDKIALVQTLNATGYKADDLTNAFNELVIEIDKTNLPKIKRDFLKEMLGSICTSVNDTEGIAKRLVQVPIELCNEKAKIPQYAHISDSGMDVYALSDITIKPGETVLVPTGIKVALPIGFELQVRPKSGRVLKTKLRIANTPGTIDQQYRDEIKIIVENVEAPIKDITINEEGKVTSILYGQNYTIGEGEKFAQLVLMEVPKASFFRVDSVSEIDGNRGGGFGSSSIYSKEDVRYGTDLNQENK